MEGGRRIAPLSKRAVHPDAGGTSFTDARPAVHTICVITGTPLPRHGMTRDEIAAAVIGIFSRGIIDTSLMVEPTVNMGARQRGRLRTSSIIDCATDRRAITTATARALDPGFRAVIAAMLAPSGDGGASRHIVDELRRTELAGLRGKAFYDLPPMAAP